MSERCWCCGRTAQEGDVCEECLARAARLNGQLGIWVPGDPEDEPAPEASVRREHWAPFKRQRSKPSKAELAMDALEPGPIAAWLATGETA